MDFDRNRAGAKFNRIKAWLLEMGPHIVSIHKWWILVSGKARARFPASRDFPSDRF